MTSRQLNESSLQTDGLASSPSTIIELEIDASVTEPTAFTLYEDIGADGTGEQTDRMGNAYDNAATVSITNGGNAYRLPGFDSSLGNEYWFSIDDPTTVREITEVQLHREVEDDDDERSYIGILDSARALLRRLGVGVSDDDQ